MARGKAHDPETKAAVMAALLSGQGVNEVAQEYQLSPSVVSGWKSSLSSEQFERLRTEKAETFDGLLSDYLTANLRALQKQAEVASEPDYIRKQSAEKLAVLHGVMADKAVRLLEAYSGSGPAPAED
jgi:transposase-like protein